jgi:hypothetical protein
MLFRWLLRLFMVTALLASTSVACVNRGMHGSELDADGDGGRAGDASPDRISKDGVADGNTTADVPKSDALADRAGAGGGDGGGGGGGGGGRSGAGGATADAGSDVRGIGGAGAGTGGHAAGGATGTGAGGAAGRGSGGSGLGGSGLGGSGLGGSGLGGSGSGGRIMDAGTPPPICSARFNFEGGNRAGAFINSGFQTAFSNLGIGTDADCGTGSLRLDATVTASANKGEVIIPLGGTEDVSGRRFSISAKSAPAVTTPNAYVIVFLVPSYAYVTAFSPIPSVWTTNTVTLPSGSGTTGISVQVLGRGDSYTGALYLDEIDLR